MRKVSLALMIALAVMLMLAIAVAPAAHAKCTTADKTYGVCTYVPAGGTVAEELAFYARPAVGTMPVRGYIAHDGKDGWWVAKVTAALVEGDTAYFGGYMVYRGTAFPPGSDAPEPVETNVYAAVQDGRLPKGAGDLVFVTIGDLVDPSALVAARVMPPEFTVPITSGEIVVLDF